MFALGHVGLTWGGALLAAEAGRRLSADGTRGPRFLRAVEPAVHRWSERIDYRFVVLGSMLPDMIDKPLGIFFLRSDQGSGHLFAHTLPFLAALALAALLGRRTLGRPLSLLALGSAVHLTLDRMWEQPQTLLWAGAGWKPHSEDLSDWLTQTLDILTSDPYVYVSEIIGGIVLVGLVALALARPGLYAFAWSGRMGPYLPPRPAPSAERRQSPQQLERGQRAPQR